MFEIDFAVYPFTELSMIDPCISLASTPANRNSGTFGQVRNCNLDASKGSARSQRGMQIVAISVEPFL